MRFKLVEKENAIDGRVFLARNMTLSKEWK